MYPKLFDLGPYITVHTYGLLLAVAFIAGIWLASRNAARQGLNPDMMWNLGLIIIFAALVGATVSMICVLTGFWMTRHEFDWQLLREEHPQEQV